MKTTTGTRETAAPAVAMTHERRISAWGQRANQRGIQLGALAVLLVGTAVLVYHVTRGSSFLFDDWSFVLNRRGGSLATYLDPHNRHFSLVPVAIYKVLFATFGIGSYVPYRVVLLACNLLLCGIFYWYARARVGAWAALVLTAVLALLGPGWEDLLWPFQIGFVLSLCAGVGALLALDQRTRRANVVAGLLVAVALASSGVGIPVALGVAVDVVVDIVRRQRSPRDVAIVAVPLVLFAAWWIGYQTGGSGIGGLGHAPSFIEKEAASVAASLFGRAGPIGLDGPGTLASWGTPLLIALVALLVLRVVRGAPVPARAAAPATMLVTFWVATAVSRADLGDPYASRYIYVGALFALMLGVELARGWTPGLVWGTLLAVLAVIAIGSNIGELRTAGALLRGYGQATTADLGALEIGRTVEPAGYIAHGLPGYPLVRVPAHEFFKIAATLGNPAGSVTTIESNDERTKEVVDRELIAIHGIAPVPVAGADATVSGCLRQAAPSWASFPITVSKRGLLIRAGTRPVSVSVRRFASLFQPVGTVTPGRSALVRIAPDRSAVPWHLQLSFSRPVTVCGL